MKVDLHTHTTCSDGRTPPVELVRLARACGIDVLAVTDHDTTDALDEAIDEGGRAGVRVVPGIEVSSTFEGIDVHILGIGVDRRHAEFQETLARLKQSRRERIAKICAALREVGLALSPEEVFAEAGGRSVGRRHVAQAMMRRGLVKSIDEAFGRYLAPGLPAHVRANDLSPADAARLVRMAGGVPSLAHPGFYRDDAQVERIIDLAALRAIEVHHAYDSPERHLRYLEIARRRDLIATGGSDYHGEERPESAALGRFLTPPEEWRRLERML